MDEAAEDVIHQVEEEVVVGEIQEEVLVEAEIVVEEEVVVEADLMV